MPESWLRRQAIQLAAQLPENPEHAMRVLELAEMLVRDFLTTQAAGERLPGDVVRFPASSNSR